MPTQDIGTDNEPANHVAHYFAKTIIIITILNAVIAISIFLRKEWVLEFLES